MRAAIAHRGPDEGSVERFGPCALGHQRLRVLDLTAGQQPVESESGAIVAVFNGPHPETGEELEVVDGPPEGVEPNDLPAETDVFAPDYAPEEISEIADKLRKAAGL